VYAFEVLTNYDYSISQWSDFCKGDGKLFGVTDPLKQARWCCVFSVKCEVTVCCAVTNRCRRRLSSRKATSRRARFRRSRTGCRDLGSCRSSLDRCGVCVRSVYMQWFTERARAHRWPSTAACSRVVSTMRTTDAIKHDEIYQTPLGCCVAMCEHAIARTSLTHAQCGVLGEVLLPRVHLAAQSALKRTTHSARIGRTHPHISHATLTYRQVSRVQSRMVPLPLARRSEAWRVSYSPQLVLQASLCAQHQHTATGENRTCVYAQHRRGGSRQQHRGKLRARVRGMYTQAVRHTCACTAH
jgi:hypothetical protein